ncbi:MULTISPECIES: hypothetical protein [Bacillaceae]|uniref:hypothetical protein n=1 Tax=Bacillaceae TaxID=186817 RepID=UPI001E45B149|nr:MULTISPECIES: hypothetical protein [Bacillaceae]MCE4048447.1 hypothetical protein [Bacillus sp. Au-Bac7]MCM3029120.1 hypothetical protein [Niallia sp. MER 6]MDL0434993.1 hypothetical protein [Niallia sp. SS-2023]UPO88799.1 hypothetical protein L8T27_006440 [Niallia sp. Man26]
MKRVIIVAIISLIVSLSSPFIFHNYLEKKPLEQKETLVFGGPIPFAEQKVQLPEEENAYPAEFTFQSPLETETKLQPFPLVFTFICYFLLIFSVYTVVASFSTKAINKNGRKKDKKDEL